ncbi:helix-turn-helix domain-containing protein [Jonquetella anthropi]|uniref:helix-turn-helix domain-containing protein n=1 Tax=Jonquetella anthropi TaxID=428712 RepID=UPI0005876635
MSKLERIQKELRAARKAKGLTLTALAQEVGSSLGYMHEVETGKAHPSLKMLEKLSRVLGLRLELLSVDKNSRLSAAKRR